MSEKKRLLPSNVKEFFVMVSWRTFGFVFLYLFGAFFFYGSKLLAPLHMPIAVFLVFLAIRRLYRLYRARRVQAGLLVLKKKTYRQILAYRLFIIVFISGLFVWYAFVSLVPTDRDVFVSRSGEDIARIVEEDTIRAAQHVDMLTVTGEALLNNVALYKEELTVDEAESVKRDWNDFLGVAMASEELTEVHRYFPQISFFEDRDLQAQSFTISYSLYMLKFAYFHRIIDAVGGSTEVRTVLNEYSEAFGGRGSYGDVTERYFAANSFLRRTVGYLYYLLMTPSREHVTHPEYAVLLKTAGESQGYLAKNVLSHLTHRSVVYTQELDEGITEAWLPIQKTVFVDTIGNIHVGERKTKLITDNDIAVMKASLLPGDIFVARKNWYASNVGIPGFWTHAGLYTGTLDDMENYFEELFPYTHEGVTYDSLTALLTAVAPRAFEVYQVPDENGYAHAVVESETKGTNVHSLEYSAHVDYFGVMRTKLDKDDVLASLLRALSHVGKPYDYTFNLTTKDEIFCSELVYDAYIPMKDKAGITLPRRVVSGMELVAPNDIVKKYVEEHGTENEELTFAYFLDGNEVTLSARPESEAVFKESYNRPKFSFLQEEVTAK